MEEVKGFQANKEKGVRTLKEEIEKLYQQMDTKNQEISAKNKEVHELKISTSRLTQDLEATKAAFQVYKDAQETDMVQELKDTKEELMRRANRKEVEKFSNLNVKEAGQMQIAMDQELLRLKAHLKAQQARDMQHAKDMQSPKRYSQEKPVEESGQEKPVEESGPDESPSLQKEVDKWENAKEIWLRVMQNAQDREVEGLAKLQEDDLEAFKNKDARDVWFAEMEMAKEKVAEDLKNAKENLKHGKESSTQDTKPQTNMETEEMQMAEEKVAEDLKNAKESRRRQSIERRFENLKHGKETSTQDTKAQTNTEPEELQEVISGG